MQDHATDLFVAITGDATARDAASFLLNYGANLGLQQCMTRSGFTFPVTIVNDWHGWRPVTGVAGTRFLVPPGTKTISSLLLATAAAERTSAAAAVAKPADTTAPYQARLRACASEAAPAQWDDPLEGHDESGVPDSAGQLRGEFLAMLADADEAAAGFGEDYAACMAGQGYPDVGGYDDIESVLAADAPAAADIPLDGEKPSAAWTEFVVEEDRAAQADVECRTEKYLLGVAGLGSRLDSFEVEHADALDAVRRDWAATVADATRYGYDPDRIAQIVRPTR